MAISEEDNVLLFEQQRLDPIPEHTYEEPVWESFLSHFTDYWQPYSGSFQSFPWTENLVLATGSGQLSSKVENCNSGSFSTTVSSSSLLPPSNPITVHQSPNTNSISGPPFITTPTMCVAGTSAEPVVTDVGLEAGTITTKNNDNNSNYADTTAVSTLPNVLINSSTAGRMPVPPLVSNILSDVSGLSPELAEEALQADRERFLQQNHNTLVMELNSLARTARHAGKSKNKSRTTDLLSGSAPLDRTCPICKKTFTRKISVNVHMVVHTNLKPYACDFPGCKKKFNVKGNLQRHSKCHRTEKSMRRLSERSSANRVRESTRIAEKLDITKGCVEERDAGTLPVALTVDTSANAQPPSVRSVAEPVGGSMCIDGTSEIDALGISSSNRVDLELVSREGESHTNFYDNSFSRYLYEDAEL